jgi:alpha-tubulin suppressor-like RCC1 family protein
VASKVPVVVSGLTRVSSVSAGVGFTCAVIAAGAAGVAKCWGADNVGQLGDHATVDALRPHVVTVDGAAALVGVTQVAAGDGYACALLVSRQARCWGRVGGFSNPAPVTVSDGTNPLTGVSQIAVGSGSACAVTSTGRVWCWGTNNYGQLGNNSTTPSESAVPVTGINGTNVKAAQVAVGSGWACARMTTGRVRCWGRNTSGQLGNGSTTNTKAPVEVTQNASTPLTGATAITTGTSHACAITVINGLRRVQCWGANNYGQLGDGTTTNRRYPTLVRTGTTIGVTNIAAGNQHTLAVIPYTLRPPTTASAWGRNNTNQLGDNTSLTRVLPTTVTRV